MTADALCLGIATETARRCLEEEVVLVVQDTTALNLTGLQGIPEWGPIDSGGLARGVHLQSGMRTSVHLRPSYFGSPGYMTLAEFAGTCVRYVPINEDLPDRSSSESTNR